MTTLTSIAEHPVGSQLLMDTFGRLHDNLRISVTDRCNIRCFYCMPEEDVKYAPREEILTFEEIERFVRVAVSLGVTKIRDYGRRAAGAQGSAAADREVVRHSRRARPGADHQRRAFGAPRTGVVRRRIAPAECPSGYIGPRSFPENYRRDDLGKVLEGIETAQRIGFGPIKINAVAVKNLVEPDIVPLARYGREQGIEIRFIEFMPLDSQGLWARENVLSADEIIETLSREISPLVEIADRDPRAPATDYRYADGVGSVGFIASVTRPFCLNCNRVRLTSDGKLRYCLFAIEETDVRALLRNGAPDSEIAATIRETVRKKWLGHEINTAKFVAPPRPMYAIGG